MSVTLREPIQDGAKRYAIVPVENVLCVRHVLLVDHGPSMPGRIRVFEPKARAHYCVALDDVTLTADSAEQRLAMLVLSGLRPLRVYHDSLGSGSNWVIAYSEEDAANTYAESIGEYMEEEYGTQLWEPLPATSRLSIYCDKSDGRPTEPSSDAVEAELTCGEWISRLGRGFLCTSEY